jgi:hypothetical protein
VIEQNILFSAYTLQMLTGNDVYYIYQAQQGDPDYSNFLSRIQNQPGETVAPNIDIGLENMKNDRTVFHVQYGLLTSVFKADPFKSQNIETFGKGPFEFYNIIFTKNSPLTPMFWLASRELMQFGVLGRLLANWQGKSIPQTHTVDKQVIMFHGGHLYNKKRCSEKINFYKISIFPHFKTWIFWDMSQFVTKVYKKLNFLGYWSRTNIIGYYNYIIRFIWCHFCTFPRICLQQNSSTFIQIRH